MTKLPEYALNFLRQKKLRKKPGVVTLLRATSYRRMPTAILCPLSHIEVTLLAGKT